MLYGVSFNKCPFCFRRKQGSTERTRMCGCEAVEPVHPYYVMQTMEKTVKLVTNVHPADRVRELALVEKCVGKVSRSSKLVMKS